MGAHSGGAEAVIEAVDTRTVVVPTDAPEADGTLAWDRTTMVLVQVRSGAAVGTGWTYGPAACATVVDDMLAAVVCGRSVFDVAGSFEAMVRSVRNAGRTGVAGFAISAVDVALWDLKARLLGLPLHRLLGAVHEGVPLYGSGGFTTYDDRQLHDQVAGWLDEGLRQVKIKVGESWGTATDRDLARMAQVRGIVGEDVGVFVDANGGYTAKQAVRVMRAARDLRVTWLEEPVSSDDLHGLRVVRESLDCDVTAGEYGCDLVYFRRMCEAGAVDCLQADLTRCGGISEWLRVAAVAASYNLEISAHCAPHLHVHVACATPNVRHLEWFHDHVRIEREMFDGALRPVDGALRPDPDAPGHGLSLRR